ncbi:MAG: DUF559 domain-containing protein [Candidatus Dojkabacteria bacterium]
MREIIPYNPKLKQLARNLRNKSTLSEVLLWKEIRNKKLLGFDFHRQRPIGNYIVDFYCSELKLAIEIDGNSHNEDKFDYDLKREKELLAIGINLIRFSDHSVKSNINNILQTIIVWIEEYEKVE